LRKSDYNKWWGRGVENQKRKRSGRGNVNRKKGYHPKISDIAGKEMACDFLIGNQSGKVKEGGEKLPAIHGCVNCSVEIYDLRN